MTLQMVSPSKTKFIPKRSGTHGGGTQTFAPVRARDDTGRVVSIHRSRRPLAPSDISVLRYLFADLEGYVGLGSSFGQMCEKMRLGQAGVFASELIPYDGNTQTVRIERPDGGLMHVKVAVPSKRLLDSPCEHWACWSNEMARSVRQARAAITWMLNRDDRPCDVFHSDEKGSCGGWLPHAVVLAKMYGQDERADAPVDPKAKSEAGADGALGMPVANSPPHVWMDDFRDLGDVTPLATMTPTVLAHAAKMTRELRESTHYGHFARGLVSGSGPTTSDVERHIAESKLEVEPLEAMYDLLVARSQESPQRRAARRELTDTVRREANRLLVEAGQAYLSAKSRLPVERRSKTWNKRAWSLTFNRRVVGYRNGLALLSCGHYVEMQGGDERRCGECADR